MNRLLWLVLLLTPLLSHGQISALAKGAKASQTAARTSAAAGWHRLTPLQATVARQHTSATQQFNQMARIVHTQLTAVPEARQSILTHKISAVTDQTNYTKTMQHFQQFKQQADPFLYYQAHSGERRTLPTEEIRQWIERVYSMERELNALRTTGVSTDQSLSQAHEYLNYVLQTVAPVSVPLSIPKTSFALAERAYDASEFFLHDPAPAPCWKRTLNYLGFKCIPEVSIPQDLDIVIFNDVETVLENLQTWQQRGQLFPTGQVHFFDSAESVRQHVIRLGNHPHLILTDLNTSRGLEGAALAQDLRQYGYDGIILALSGYSEETINGDALLFSGIDGTISRSGKTDDLLRRHILKSVQNYYYYQNLHQWSR